MNTKFSLQFVKKLNGFTLIELLVSMTISLTLIGGLMSMYLGSRVTDKTRTELSDIESNARIALNSLRQTIEHAGYKTIEGIDIERPFQIGAISNPSCSDNKPLVVNSFLQGATNLTKDGNTSDAITVVYGADHPDKGDIYLDCAGNGYETSSSTALQNKARLVACSSDKKHDEQNDSNIANNDTAEGMNSPADAKIYSYFTIKRHQLTCVGSRSVGTTSYIIADNIEGMQFRYGILKDGKTSYKNATDVENDNEWEAVTSVQVAILVASEKEVLTQAKTTTFRLLDRNIKKINSKKMFKVYNTTINLPNRRRRAFQ